MDRPPARRTVRGPCVDLGSPRQGGTALGTLLEGMADQVNQVLDGKGGPREVLAQTAAEAQRLLDAVHRPTR